jgi:hypothetical protein
MAKQAKSDKKPLSTRKKQKPEKKKPEEKFFTQTKEEREVREKSAYADFIHWSILTDDERKAAKEPKTQKGFAIKWQINEDTITNWKKREDYEERRGREFKHKLALEEPKIMESLVKRIHKYGQAMDVELWYALVKGWDKKRILEIKNPVVIGEGDIRLLIGKLPKEKQKSFYETLTKLMAEAQDAEENANELATSGTDRKD